MANKRNLKSAEKELLAQVFVKTLPLDRIIITDNLDWRTVHTHCLST